MNNECACYSTQQQLEQQEVFENKRKNKRETESRGKEIEQTRAVR
jgi:hypothetical protein